MKYITKDNDRWDLIAYQFYGNPYLYEPIMLENPDKISYFAFPAGVMLEIPAIWVDETIEVSPPWQRD
ncbi:tail protein X [Thermodesulfovibrio thiophilus]|uniref:tail protein X n=1 Tax=Thermodesulfovibrio thiophilus TaxID=340095 RepID=UPI000411CA89|nr:tail protein X [Thermodesulfovibrio thiophilus]